MLNWDKVNHTQEERTIATSIFIARVQSTREGTVFTVTQVSVCSHLGRGYPRLANGGMGITTSGWQRDTPIWLMGGGEKSIPIWLTKGYPLIGTGWGYLPHQDWMGYPPVRTGWGYPPPPNGRSGDRAATRQAVCLLRSRRRTFLFSLHFCQTASFTAVSTWF